MIRLGQTKATDPFTHREFWQIFLPLRLGSEFVNRHHDQRALHAHHRAITGIDTLNLTRDQAVSHIVQPRATVLLRNRRAKQPERAHLTKNLDVGVLIAKSLNYTRQQLVLCVLRRGIANHALVFSKLLIEKQGIAPVEAGFGRGRHVQKLWGDVAILSAQCLCLIAH